MSRSPTHKLHALVPVAVLSNRSSRREIAQCALAIARRMAAAQRKYGGYSRVFAPESGAVYCVHANDPRYESMCDASTLVGTYSIHAVGVIADDLADRFAAASASASDA